jgi:hypothetical protein
VFLWDTFSSADLAALGRGREGRAVPETLRALVD